MRISRGLENIKAVIDRHETDWRIEHGEDPDSVKRDVKRRIETINSRIENFTSHKSEKRVPERSEPEKIAEPATSLEPEITAEPTETKRVKLSEDRFLGGSVQAVAHEEVPEILSGLETADESESIITNEPEAVEIIPNNEGRHSWLYNEVMKAVNDAAKGSSAKIIAVFIPVVQSGKEFEDLPADETVTTSPLDESLAKIEAPEMTTPAGIAMPEIDSPDAPSTSAEIDSPDETATPETESPDESAMPDEPTADETATPAEADMPDELSAPEIDTPDETTSSEDFNLIPETPPEQKAEIAEAFREMEEKLEETLQEENEPEISQAEPENEIVAEESSPEILPEDSVPEILTEPEIPQAEPEAEIVIEESSPEVLTDESETVTLTEESVPEIETEPEISESENEPDVFTEELMPAISQPESENDEEEDDNDVLQDGEPMDFEEIDSTPPEKSENSAGNEELVLQDELDDDEIFDESLTEVHKPDDDGTLVVDGDKIFLTDKDDDGEIEIVPDPERRRR